MKERLAVSVSGGRSSMYMAYRLFTEYQDQYEMVFLFANTGQEREETLEFVHQFETTFNIPIVWLEAVIYPEVGQGTRHQIADFYTAARRGEPFEAMIAKYGIPHVARPRCTETLKVFPINSYKRAIGWKGVKQAIGIRADEPKRYAKRKPKMIYPLVDSFPVTKQDVLDWWAKQSFDLQLKEYEGNCSWCYKKSLPKLKRLLSEKPELFDFPERMEEKYGLVRARLGTPQKFFRGQRSVQDLRDLNAQDDEAVLDDITNECGESCEAI